VTIAKLLLFSLFGKNITDSNVSFALHRLVSGN
jgi:hypothetical protein